MARRYSYFILIVLGIRFLFETVLDFFRMSMVKLLLYYSVSSSVSMVLPDKIIMYTPRSYVKLSKLICGSKPQPIEAVRVNFTRIATTFVALCS